jgi:hypothetical protein
VPIQPPLSPDGRFVGVAVMSLTTVARPCTGSSDHVAIIDTAADTVVKFLGVPTEAGKANGAHGANFGAKLGGGYYVHVASRFSNKLTVVDLDPNGDGSAADAAAVGRVLLANGVPGGPRTTDGTGGQGIKPLPNVQLQAVAVIVIPPRAFCLSVTVTSPVSSPSASATSSRIRTANPSQKAPSFR